MTGWAGSKLRDQGSLGTGLPAGFPCGLSGANPLPALSPQGPSPCSDPGESEPHLASSLAPPHLPFQDWPVSFSSGRAQGSTAPSSKTGAELEVPAEVRVK